jgi:hypothetical protein
MHDAIQAFEGHFESYSGPIPNVAGSPIAAAARAAHDVLVARFPTQSGTLDTFLNNYLNGLGLQGDEGLVIGQQAAANILNLRAGDGSFPSNPEDFVGGTGPGEWRPTPPAFAPMVTPWLGTVAPFTLNDTAPFRASPPPTSLESGKYVHDYNEVKALGSVNSTGRTQVQTDLALFYSDNFLALWERTLRGIADMNINKIGHSPALKSVLVDVDRVAPTDSTVLVLGETGTGKELIARAIHNLSARCGRPFIKLNCAAIPFDL